MHISVSLTNNDIWTFIIFMHLFNILFSLYFTFSSYHTYDTTLYFISLNVSMGWWVFM